MSSRSRPAAAGSLWLLDDLEHMIYYSAMMFGRRRKKRQSSSQINWNNVLLDQIRLAKLPEPRLEYQFHANRQWRFDFCWKASLVACEIEGGIWMQTKGGYSKGHAHPERFEQDCEKYNEAALYGWTVIRVTPQMVRDGRALEWLERALLIE